jgi:hypothetical protein
MPLECLYDYLKQRSNQCYTRIPKQESNLLIRHKRPITEDNTSSTEDNTLMTEDNTLMTEDNDFAKKITE